MYSAQKGFATFSFHERGFAPILIILLTVLAVGSTTFLVFVSNPDLISKINPSVSKAKTQTTLNKTETTSTNTLSKNAFQVLKDKILPPKSSTPLTNNTSQNNTVTPTTSPTNIDTSKEISRYGSTEKSSPTSTPTSSSTPVNPNEDVPIYYK